MTNEERARILASHFEPFDGWKKTAHRVVLERAIFNLLQGGCEPVVVEIAVRDVLRIGDKENIDGS